MVEASYVSLVILMLLSLTILTIYLTLTYKRFFSKDQIISKENYADDTKRPLNPLAASSTFPAYVICLSDKAYNTALKNIKIPNLNKFDAIKGSTLDLTKVNLTMSAKRSVLMDTIRNNHADFGTANGVGCYLSHVALWQKVVDENLAGMYIFESDAVCMLWYSWKTRRY